MNFPLYIITIKGRWSFEEKVCLCDFCTCFVKDGYARTRYNILSYLKEVSGYRIASYIDVYPGDRCYIVQDIYNEEQLGEALIKYTL